MRYEEILGSDDYLSQLVEAAIALRDNGLPVPQGISSNFVVVSPGGEIRQGAFISGI
jgi:hypothetical protein